MNCLGQPPWIIHFKLGAVSFCTSSILPNLSLIPQIAWDSLSFWPALEVWVNHQNSPDQMNGQLSRDFWEATSPISLHVFHLCVCNEGGVECFSFGRPAFFFHQWTGPYLWIQIQLCMKMRQFLTTSVLLMLSNAYFADLVFRWSRILERHIDYIVKSAKYDS